MLKTDFIKLRKDLYIPIEALFGPSYDKTRLLFKKKLKYFCRGLESGPTDFVITKVDMQGQLFKLSTFKTIGILVNLVIGFIAGLSTRN